MRMDDAKLVVLERILVEMVVPPIVVVVVVVSAAAAGLIVAVMAEIAVPGLALVAKFDLGLVVGAVIAVPVLVVARIGLAQHI